MIMVSPANMFRSRGGLPASRRVQGRARASRSDQVALATYRSELPVVDTSRSTIARGSRAYSYRAGSTAERGGRGPSRAPTPSRTNAGATGSTKCRSVKSPRALTRTTSNAPSGRASRRRAPRGLRTASATSPTTIHCHGRGYHRDSWLSRSASPGLPFGPEALRRARRGGAGSRGTDLARPAWRK